MRKIPLDTRLNGFQNRSERWEDVTTSVTAKDKITVYPVSILD
jgi:hypothetical protein